MIIQKNSRKENMGAYIETFILYILLFFGRSTGSSGFEITSFSITIEIVKILLIFIPSLAIIWYFKHKNWNIRSWIIKPGLKDLICALITLPCLMIIGFSIAFFSTNTGSTQITLHTPSSVLGWIVLAFSCFFSAYLEEGFFRFYLLSKRNELNLGIPAALFLSTALFSICHLYAGPWWFLNSIISGLVLCLLFLRFNSLHGIAIAHGIYNIIAYIVNAVNSG
jgi:hypothetical protein